jgi:hypothetical protein
MRQIKGILMFMSFALAVTSCIKPYNPEIRGSDAKKYVVMGRVSNVDTIQTVNITITSPVSEPEYLPVKGCDVKILDDLGNEYTMTDMEDGNYKVWISPDQVTPGKAFMVDVITPGGDHIISDYDTVKSCPPIDSVYFLREDIEGNNPGDFTLGIQFYIDLKGSDSDSRNYLWEEYETWEYHTEYPLEWWYDGTVHHVFPPDYSYNICWRTLKVPYVYTLTTGNLSANEYQRFPLHYVDNHSSRLQYGYSLLVKQIALSDAAYSYWDQMRINSSQEGGLYEKQPLAVKGNLQNLTHKDYEVLGFFGASSENDKRLFYTNPGLPLEVYTYCSPAALRKGLIEISPRDYPAYLMGDANNWWPVLLNDECVDCRVLYGVNVKPDFWPN